MLNLFTIKYKSKLLFSNSNLVKEFKVGLQTSNPASSSNVIFFTIYLSFFNFVYASGKQKK